MIEYNLKLLRSNEVLESYETAVQVLSSYKDHCIGQPVVLYYNERDAETDEDKTRALFAVGTLNGEGKRCGKEYYSIVNITNIKKSIAEENYWINLGSSIPGEAYRLARYDGNSDALIAGYTNKIASGTVVYCFGDHTICIRTEKKYDKVDLSECWNVFCQPTTDAPLQWHTLEIPVQ